MEGALIRVGCGVMPSLPGIQGTAGEELLVAESLAPAGSPSPEGGSSWGSCTPQL